MIGPMNLTRRLKGVAVVWSALLCAGTVAVWVVSCHVRVFGGWAKPLDRTTDIGLEWELVDVSDGRMRLDVARSVGYQHDRVLHPGFIGGTFGLPASNWTPVSPGVFADHGFGVERGSAWERADGLTRLSLFGPCWFVVLVTAVPPAAWATAAVRRRRVKRSRGFEVRLHAVNPAD